MVFTVKRIEEWTIFWVALPVELLKYFYSRFPIFSVKGYENGHLFILESWSILRSVRGEGILAEMMGDVVRFWFLARGSSLVFATSCASSNFKVNVFVDGLIFMMFFVKFSTRCWKIWLLPILTNYTTHTKTHLFFALSFLSN